MVDFVNSCQGLWNNIFHGGNLYHRIKAEAIILPSQHSGTRYYAGTDKRVCFYAPCFFWRENRAFCHSFPCICSLFDYSKQWTSPDVRENLCFCCLPFFDDAYKHSNRYHYHQSAAPFQPASRAANSRLASGNNTLCTADVLCAIMQATGWLRGIRCRRYKRKTGSWRHLGRRLQRYGLHFLLVLHLFGLCNNDQFYFSVYSGSLLVKKTTTKKKH